MSEEGQQPPPPPATVSEDSARLYSDADLRDQLGVLIREALRRGISVMAQDYSTPPPPPPPTT